MARKRKGIKIIPLGGLGHIGKNMTVIEYNNEMIIVDCGMMFPDDEMFGIDYVIPDFSYVLENADKLIGILITHGHEDHLGALPYLLKQVQAPVYGTELTVALAKNKLKEHPISFKDFHVVTPDSFITLGPYRIEFMKMSHSIAGAVALAIHTPIGTLLHTGDFKIDFTPADGDPINLQKFGQLGHKGVLALLSDSTNAERPGYTMSEQRVSETFGRLFEQAQGRIIVASFASNVYRTQQIIDAAERFGRKICLVGRSMVNVVDIVRELGILRVNEKSIIEVEMLKRFRDDEVLILTTGSQGEELSGLARMASGNNAKVDVGPGDLVIISASPIPGNEKSVYTVINRLFKRGANVIYESMADVHVSGHACQEELKLMLSLIKPKFFIPVHGEYRHLKRHGMLAQDMGIPKDHIFELEIGNVLEINTRSAKVVETVSAGSVLIDGSGVGDVGNVVLRDRKLLSEDGLIVLVIALDTYTGQIVDGPDIISRGFVYVRESEDMMDGAKRLAEKIVLEHGRRKEYQGLKNMLRNKLRSYFYDLTKRSPMILPIIMEVDE
ncbi:MAG: ribonuclease J [Christensenellales bacterium]